jgi:salicylate hydroxylase
VSVANVTTVLSVYDEIRRPIGNDVVERSLKLGFLYEFHPEYMPAGTDIEKLHAGDPKELSKVVDEVKKTWSFHWEGSPERDWERANDLLELRLVQ